ncbi:hypothetical protein V6N13_026222 [Hibiscus sabdariffa]
MQRGLSEELISSIAAKCPVASVIRFQAVAKFFGQLVKDSQFIDMHMENGSKYILLRSLMLGRTDSRLHLVPLSNANGDNSPIIEMEIPPIGTNLICKLLRGSYRGLVCLTNCEGEIVLLNPMLKSFAAVPDLKQEFEVGFQMPFIMSSLGYSLVDKDVKVASFYRLQEVDEGYMNKVFVFSLKTNHWTQIQACPYPSRYIDRLIPAGGALHWL